MSCWLCGTSIAEDYACPIYSLCMCFLSCKWGKMQCNSCNDLLAINVCMPQCHVQALCAGWCRHLLCLIETVCSRQSEFATKWCFISVTLNVKVRVEWRKQYCCIPVKQKALLWSLLVLAFLSHCIKNLPLLILWYELGQFFMHFRQ